MLEMTASVSLGLGFTLQLLLKWIVWREHHLAASKEFVISSSKVTSILSNSDGYAGYDVKWQLSIAIERQ